MEEESWRRNHGGGIMEEESWRRNHGGGIMEEESWRRNQGGGIREEESWGRNHGGGIMEETSERLLKGICKHLEGIWRHPGDTQEAPRRHPGTPRDTQEAARRSEASGTHKLKDVCSRLQYFGRDNLFRMRGVKVTLTKYAV